MAPSGRIEPGIAYDASQPFSFDSGDVKITVKVEGKIIVGSVSSACMVHASPVWAKLLFPPWRVEEKDFVVSSGVEGKEDESKQEDATKQEEDVAGKSGKPLGPKADATEKEAASNKSEAQIDSINKDDSDQAGNFAIISFPQDDSSKSTLAGVAEDSADPPTQAFAPSKDATVKQLNPTTLSPVDELDFSEDITDALLILLRIAHLKFTFIPSVLSARQLWGIAILCDKYDCVTLIKPYLDGWLSIDDPQEDCWTSLKNGWLFTSWVLGCSERLEQLSLQILKTGVRDKNLTLMVKPETVPKEDSEANPQTKIEADPFDDYLLPPGLQARINSLHEVALKTLIHIPWSGFEF